MELNEVKKLVEYFEDRIINKFDEHFSNLVLEDFYSDGGDVGRIEDEWFYEEYFSRYEEDIIELLNDINFDDKNYFNFQLRLIKLKRIIDNKLSEITREEDKNNLKRSERVDSFLLNSKIENEDLVIKNLYNELILKNLIQTKLESFQLLFKYNSNPISKIQWRGTEPQITYLITHLIGKILSSEIQKHKLKLISKYFTNKNGGDFKPKQLSSAYRRAIINFPHEDPILDIIKKVSTNK